MTEFICWRDPKHTDITITRFGWPQCACGAAPPYHDRPDYLPKGFQLGIYVPVEGPLRAIIADRSGVVGLPSPADASDPLGRGPEARTLIYYEGWTNGPMQYADRDTRGLWEAGVEHAASRMITQYPTVAQAFPLSTTLKNIGLYDPRAHTFDIHDEEALDAWLKN